MPERPRHEAQVAMERILQLVPEQRRNIINCTTCGQINLKVQRNNHIKCWLCKTNVCFECKKKIIGNVTSHYILSNCKQHSQPRNRLFLNSFKFRIELIILYIVFYSVQFVFLHYFILKKKTTFLNKIFKTIFFGFFFRKNLFIKFLVYNYFCKNL